MQVPSWDEATRSMWRVQKTYLLIFFSLWCHFDDVLLPPLPSSQAASRTDADDEYLSIEREQGLKGSASFQKFRPISLSPRACDFLSHVTCKESPLGGKRASPFGSCSLYAFMPLLL